MIENTSGSIVQHTDGRRGVAYNRDQQLSKDESKRIVRFFSDKTMKDLSRQKRMVSKDKLWTIGFID